MFERFLGRFVAFLSSVLGGLCLLIPTGGAVTLSTTVTADNHYGLYYGSETNLTFVGRNEKGGPGNPGTYNWSLPETFAGLQLSESDRFFIVVWDDSIVDGSQALLGQFITDDGGTLLTNAGEWAYFVTNGTNPGTDGDPPSANSLEALLVPAQWTHPLSTALNGTEVWAAYTGGPTPGISTQAYWLCRVTCDGSTSALTVYRSAPMSEIQGRVLVLGAVPLSATSGLLGAGLLAALIVRSRRSRCEGQIA